MCLPPRIRLLPYRLTVLLILGSAVTLRAADPLETGFAEPPREARPLVWWHWINGNVTKHGIEADLADMRRQGIAGVQMFDASIYLPAGPVRYGTDSWHEHVQHAIATADRLGLEFHLMNTPGWSASGGPWVTPERSMQQLAWSETAAEGARPVTLPLPVPELPRLKFRTPPTRGPQRNLFRDIAVLAVPAGADRRTQGWPAKVKLEEKTLTALPPDDRTDGCIPPEQVLDLTAAWDAASGTLRTTLPAGRWTILRLGFTSTGATNHPAVPEGHGLEIDKLDPDAVSFQFDQALGRILREAGPRAGRTLRGLLFDSFEGGPQNWTGTFPAQFRALKGYDLVPLLPVLTGRVIGSPAFTEAVLRDFRGVVEELIARNYFGTMQRRAHEHGLAVYAEAQGGPLNPVSCGEFVDVPMNEFWLPDAAPRLPRLKLTASVANVLGRRIIAAEAFTAKPEDGRWQATPAALKGPGDYAWTAGVNRFVLHHYTHQPTDDGPGFGLGRYGTHFGRLNSWWPLAGAWVSYVARGQFLLQQGRTVADVAFLQTEDHGYAYPAAMTVPPAGYDYDIVYPRHVAGMITQDGALMLPSGAAYRILVLPENWAAELTLLRQLRGLTRAGAIVVGPPPTTPAGRRDHEAREEFASVVRELWDGPHPLIRRLTPPAAIAGLGLPPDVASPSAPAGAQFRHLHRRTEGADIYFVLNHGSAAAKGGFTFRTAGRQPELWDAVTGTRRDAAFTATATTTTVPLELKPDDSVFVVFRRPATGSVANPPPAPVIATLPVEGPWEVRFHDGRGAPPTASFPQLTSWSDHPEPGIRYYSGTATYRATFTVSGSASAAATLDLGTVADLADVRLNGTDLGTLWRAPFRVDVTRHVRAGRNTLEVRVANRWINRVIGDESLPTDLSYQKEGTNKFTDGRLETLPAWLYDRARLPERQRHSFTTWRHYTADTPLVPSGLLGPVRIEWQGTGRP